MACVATTDDGHDCPLAVKILLLSCVLVVSVVGNVGLAVRLGRQEGRSGRRGVPCQALLLMRVTSVLGAVSATVNVGVYLATLLSGGWPFGEPACQVYGIVSNVLISGWLWLLVLSLAERFVWIVDSEEYPSLFSPINTRILVWGAHLLLTISFAAPTYGWAEYSPHRGQLSILIHVSNNSALYRRGAEAAAGQPLSAILVDPTLAGDARMLLARTAEYFAAGRDLSVRSMDLVSAGILLKVRASTSSLVDCLRSDQQSGRLATEMTRSVTCNVSALDDYVTSTGDVTLDVSIARQELVDYQQLVASYQHTSTCGLDYSDVNKHVTSFVVFMLLQVVVLPLLLVVYFGCRTAVHVVAGKPSPSVTSDDLRNSVLLAAVCLASLVAGAAHQACGVVAGRLFGFAAHHIPAWLHFAAHVSMYAATALLPVFYAVVFRKALCLHPLGGACCRRRECAQRSPGDVESASRKLLQPTSAELQSTTAL